jgi:hypothetical protein
MGPQNGLDDQNGLKSKVQHDARKDHPFWLNEIHRSSVSSTNQPCT